MSVIDKQAVKRKKRKGSSMCDLVFERCKEERGRESVRAIASYRYRQRRRSNKVSECD